MGPMPPGLFGFRKEAVNRVVYDVVDGKPSRKSIEEAKKLLAEAGYPDGRDAQSGQPLVLNYDYHAFNARAEAESSGCHRRQDGGSRARATITTASDKVRQGQPQFLWVVATSRCGNFSVPLYGPTAG